MAITTSAIDKSTLGLHPLEQYEPLIGLERQSASCKKADRVGSAHLAHVSSTFYGGGVTEILTPLT